MASFQNGLWLEWTPYGAPYVGTVVTRWLYEFLGYVVGRTIVDTPVGTAWSNVVASEWSPGTGQSVAGEPDQFDIGTSTYNFQPEDEGAYLTISGFTPSTRDGIYRIRRVLSSKIVQLWITEGVHEDGIPTGQTAIKWRLWRTSDATYIPVEGDSFVFAGTGLTNAGYTYHVKATVSGTGSSGFPTFEMGPYGNWDSVGHAWIDNRHTAALTAGADGTWNDGWLWAHADENTVFWWWRNSTRGSGETETRWGFNYVGELDPFYPANDPRPVFAWSNYAYIYDDTWRVLGYGQDSNSYRYMNMLAHDDLTTVSAYPMILHAPTSFNDNWIGWYRTRWSQYSRKMYRFPIIAESRTSGFHEVRGALRGLWLTARATKPMLPYGSSHEYLHVLGGLSIPWHGSKTHVIRITTSM